MNLNDNWKPRWKKKEETPEQRTTRIWNLIMVAGLSAWLIWELYIKK